MVTALEMTRPLLWAPMGAKLISLDIVYLSASLKASLPIQAAVGVAQMEKLEEHLARKRAIHRQYREGLAEVLGVSLWPADHDGSSHWLSAVQVAAKGALLQHLRGRGIEALSLYSPLHQLPDYQEHPPRYVGGEAAEDLWATTALLPSGCGLSEAQVEEVIVEVCRWAGQR